mgnify:FL=1
MIYIQTSLHIRFKLSTWHDISIIPVLIYTSVKFSLQFSVDYLHILAFKPRFAPSI